MDKNVEQLSLKLDYKDNILCYLNKSDKPLSSRVIQDEMTKIATNNFDYEFDGEIKFYQYEVPNELKNIDFNIMCIVGSSGSGKSTFSRQLMMGGQLEEQIKWDNSKAIISHFKSEKEAIEKLNSVGLNSIPNWLKPYNVLSVGEKFRVDLARRIKDNSIIDEYTSTIDRLSAISCSVSISRYIKNKNIKKVVFVSCHRDFIDYISPDYVVDLDDECVYDTRRLPRKKFKLQLYEEQSKKEIWRIFGKYHYLSQELNYVSRMFSLRLNDQPIAICCILPLPNGYFDNGYRIHRLVVLPEYQGMGIGTKLLDIICNILVKNGKVPYIRTSHAKLINYLNYNEDWKETSRSGTISPSLFSRHEIAKNRIANSYKYIGKYKSKYDDIKDIHFKGKSNIIKQTLF